MVDTIITLYESTDTEFESNGIGTLSDAIKCEITEERNGTFELEMEYPINGIRYKELQMRRIIVTKTNPYSNLQPFRIYSMTKPINGIVTIYAQHISYDMSGYPVAPFIAGNIQNAFLNMKSSSAIDCPFTFSTDKTTVATISNLKPTSMRSLLGGVEGSILDIYGGEYEFDNYNVKLWNNRGSNKGVSIRYGKNLTDLKQEESCSSVYTGVYPFWYTEQEGLVQLDEKVLSAPGTYNFTRIYSLDLSQEWEEKPTQEQLRNRANAYMKANNIGIPTVSLTVSFVQLSQSTEYADYTLLEDVRLCDTVNVEFPELNVSSTAKCITTTYDAITNKYVSIELGESRGNLASTIYNQNQSITSTTDNMQQAIDLATKLITGGLGGHVIMHSSTGGRRPDEMLVMDTDDIQTASNVWRWNKNGFGHSSTGYNGLYTTAMTMDGRTISNSGKIGNWNIDEKLYSEGDVYVNPDWNDQLIISNINSSSTDAKKPVTDKTKIYDFDNDGFIDIKDALYCRKLIEKSMTMDELIEKTGYSAKISHIKTIINPNDPTRTINMTGKAWNRDIDYYFGVNGLKTNNVNAGCVKGGIVMTENGVDLDKLSSNMLKTNYNEVSNVTESLLGDRISNPIATFKGIMAGCAILYAEATFSMGTYRKFIEIRKNDVRIARQECSYTSNGTTNVISVSTITGIAKYDKFTAVVYNGSSSSKTITNCVFRIFEIGK